MPCAPRPNKKTEKIIFGILGTPPNMRKEKKKKNDKSKDELIIQENKDRRLGS